MDLSIYLNMIFSAAWDVIAIFIFAVTIKSAWFKGFFSDDKEYGTIQIDPINKDKKLAPDYSDDKIRAIF